MLYDYWRSSAAYRVRIALGLKGLAFERVAVDLASGGQRSPGFTLLNPQGLVPALIDGEVAFAQSLAIIEYLDETYPDPPLLPADTLGRARVRAAALAIACDIHPLNNLRVLTYLKSEMAQSQDAVDTWVRLWIATGFGPLEEIAAASGGPYLVGAAPTIADCCIVPQIYNARRFKVDLGPFPALVAVDFAMQALAAVRAARPQAPAEAG